MNRYIFMIVIFMMFILSSKNSAYNKYREVKESKQIKGNFINDILQYNSDELVLVTGNGLSYGKFPLGQPDFKWFNTMNGHGGVSAYDFIDLKGKRIDFLSTGEYNYYEDVEGFATINNGLSFSFDKGNEWFTINPPIHWKRDKYGNYVKAGTPIEGICYQMDVDSTNHLWLACFGQSLQRISLENIENWQTDKNKSKPLNTDTLWQTIWPSSVEWSPAKPGNQEQILFTVHSTKKGYLFAGSAEGAHLLLNYDAQPKDFRWLNFDKSKIFGNWITVINSQLLEDGRELVWLAVWPTGNDEIYTVVNLEIQNNGEWKVRKIPALDGIKAYNFAFRRDEVFIATTQGLFYAESPNSKFEKYDLTVLGEHNLSGLTQGYDNVYSVYANENYLLVGTNKGLLISYDGGFSFKSFESGKPAEKTYAYPNPFSPYKHKNIKIRFKALNSSYAKVDIYNFAMEKTRSFTSSVKYSIGDHYLTWNGRDDNGKIVANGSYFYKLQVGNKTYWSKILVFK